MGIRTVHELWLDRIKGTGVTRDVSLHFRAEFDDGRVEWHCYGDPVNPLPVGATAKVHAPIHFPAEFLNLAEQDANLLYDLAYMVARNVLA